MHDPEPRLERMYRRDRLIALLLVTALIATLGTVFVATGRFAGSKVRGALAFAGAALIFFNGASIGAMLRHNREDRTFIYTLDLKHLDEYRRARAARRTRRSDA